MDVMFWIPFLNSFCLLFLFFHIVYKNSKQKLIMELQVSCGDVKVSSVNGKNVYNVKTVIDFEIIQGIAKDLRFYCNDNKSTPYEIFNHSSISNFYIDDQCKFNISGIKKLPKTMTTGYLRLLSLDATWTDDYITPLRQYLDALNHIKLRYSSVYDRERRIVISWCAEDDFVEDKDIVWHQSKEIDLEKYMKKLIKYTK